MTYALLNLVVLIAVTGVSLTLARLARVGARWWLSVALVATVLVGLTVVFDSLMIWADLFRFDDATLLGITLWRAPVEDLAWPIASALLLPALWTWLGARKSARLVTVNQGNHEEHR
jgi:lycopene cyclase domain-containing protein